MAKLKVGERLILAANDQVTLILRRVGRGAHNHRGRPIRERNGRLLSGYVLETYDANIAAFDPEADGTCRCAECAGGSGRKARRHPPAALLSRVLFEDESRARDLARAIGMR